MPSTPVRPVQATYRRASEVQSLDHSHRAGANSASPHSRLPGIAGVPHEGDSETDKQRWVDEVVQTFCRHHRFFDRFVKVVDMRGLP